MLLVAASQHTTRGLDRRGSTIAAGRRNRVRRVDQTPFSPRRAQSSSDTPTSPKATIERAPAGAATWNKNARTREREESERSRSVPVLVGLRFYPLAVGFGLATLSASTCDMSHYSRTTVASPLMATHALAAPSPSAAPLLAAPRRASRLRSARPRHTRRRA